MPVTPHYPNLFHHQKELHQFLVACTQTLIEKKQSKFVSISLKIPLIDPLAVIDTIAETGQLHFYMSQEKGKEAIAAIDAVRKFTVEGGRRFSQVQQFIDSCLANTITTGDLDLPFAGPHFFCSFTFFDNNIKSDYSFPSATVFLPKWQIASSKDYSVIVANIALDLSTNIELLSDSLWRKFQQIILIKKKVHINTDSPNKSHQNFLINKQGLKNSIISVIESIRSNHLSKIVLAQAIEVIAKKPFSLVDSLDNLRINHPDCYVFSASNGKGQCFIGASPERLISIQNQELETDALAGSVARGKNAVEDAYFADQLLMSEKERREHLVVSDFIVKCLSRMGMTLQKLPQPSLLRLSNIQHLWTPISAKIPPEIHALEILAELHPTPAVAGFPRNIACDLIRRYETFDRSLYAAPLGWIDYQGNSQFIVGIRSALIDGDRAILYAGAGIVSGSDPDREIAEIQLKFQTLLKALV